LLGSGGTGFLFQGRGEQAGGFAPPEDFGESEVAAGGLLADHAHGQADLAEGGEPVEGAPALDGEALAVSGQPGVLPGGESLDVKLATGSVGRCHEGAFQVIDRIKVTG